MKQEDKNSGPYLDWAWEDLPWHVKAAVALFVALLLVYVIFWNYFDASPARDSFAWGLLVAALGAIAVVAGFEAIRLCQRQCKIDTPLRRSQLVLGIGLTCIVIIGIVAKVLGVPVGDIFAGTMGGLGAVVAAMAAFESADAARSANEIAAKALAIANDERLDISFEVVGANISSYSVNGSDGKPELHQELTLEMQLHVFNFGNRPVNIKRYSLHPYFKGAKCRGITYGIAWKATPGQNSIRRTFVTKVLGGGILIAIGMGVKTNRGTDFRVLAPVVDMTASWFDEVSEFPPQLGP